MIRLVGLIVVMFALANLFLRKQAARVIEGHRRVAPEPERHRDPAWRDRFSEHRAVRRQAGVQDRSWS